MSARHAHAAKVHLYDRLFRAPEPGKDREFLEDINPDSRRTVEAQVEPSLGNLASRQPYQFERHGYFIADYDQRSFNRTVTLRDSWSKS